MEFNEQEAIDYIRAHMPEGSLANVDDDEILNIIDMIFDYYEAHGMLDIDSEGDDDELDFADLVAYVKKMLAKDKESPVNPDEVADIVKAELDYEESISEF